MTVVTGTLVIGGGPAGAAAACRLAASGHAVTLVERSLGPHDKICGEFMSIEAQLDLQRLGIDPAQLGARPIDRLRLVSGRHAVTCPLPFRALSLSRRRLDEALLARAADLGATIRRGVTVHALQTTDGIASPREAEFQASGQAPYQTIVLASGKHTLRGAARRARPSDLVGFKMYYQLADPARIARQVQIHLFDGGYAGIEPVEHDAHATPRINLCLLVRQSQLAARGGTWPTLLDWLLATQPALAELLAGATALLPRPIGIAGVPYGFVHRPEAADPTNVFRVGDQMAVIPSFCGDGMSIALRSGIAAADAIAEGRSAREYHAALRRSLRGQMTVARAIAAAGRTGLGRAALIGLAAALPSLVTHAIRATRVQGDAGLRPALSVSS